MKALSIRQPWAWAIIHAGKDIENRSWATRYRGRFLVHASQGMTRGEYDDARRFMEKVLRDRGEPRPYGELSAVPSFVELERGGIIGSVELVDCVSDSASPWFFGAHGFVLANPEPSPFRALKGKLGFFDTNITHLLATPEGSDA